MTNLLPQNLDRINRLNRTELFKFLGILASKSNTERLRTKARRVAIRENDKDVATHLHEISR